MVSEYIFYLKFLLKVGDDIYWMVSVYIDNHELILVKDLRLVNLFYKNLSFMLYLKDIFSKILLL